MSFDPAARFAGRRVPPWLRRFAAEPQAALHDLLMGRAALGHLDAAEPGDILLDWLRLLPADFTTAVDAALAAWIEAHWGDSLPEGSGGHAALTAEAWMRACDLIALTPGLAGAEAALRRPFLAQPRFLESLGEGRARDPQSRAWQALARHQADRSLLPQWWTLCRLPPDQPWRRGACGVDGLLWLPAKNAHGNGGFPVEAAEGLLCLGAALWQRQQDGWLPAEAAREEWLGIAQMAELAAPFPDRWQAFWRSAQAEPRCQNWAKWIRRLHSNLGQAKPRTASRHADENWPRRAKDLARRIGNDDDSAIGEAEALLQEQRCHAETSGDAEPYARSAVSFSSAARRRGWLPQALAWAEAARASAPWNAHAWVNAATCLRQSNRPEALSVALEAARRFPNDPVASAGLAETLKAQNRMEEAEAQYRLAVERFPNDAVARNGLAETLKAQNRTEEAEAQYRLAVERFPNDAFARAGLAETLKAQGRMEEAEAQYRLAVERFPDNAVARNGLAETLKARGRLEEAEAQYRLTLDRFPNDVFARTGLASVSRLRQRLESGELPDLAEPGAQTAEPAADDAPLPPAPSLAAEPAVPAQAQTGNGPTPPAKPPPALSHDEIQILTADAYLIRCWRRATGQSAAHLLPGRLQERAEKLLRRLLAFEADALAVGEAGLLEISAGEAELALALLRQAAKRFPGSSRVRYALARAEREVGGLASVPDWRRLARLDARMRPLALLGEGRARLAEAAQDGAAADILGALGHCLQPHLRPLDGVAAADGDVEAARKAFAAPDDNFMGWWAREVHAYLFGARPVADAEHLPPWDWLAANARLDALDGLEEDYLGRYAAA
jgi:tetratricopeptide (TPR) repeat protein